MGIALYSGGGKKSQYQVWNYEDSIQSKNIILVMGGQFEGSEEYPTRMGKSIHYKEIDNFTSFNNIKIKYNVEDIIYEEDSIKILVQILNHRQYPVSFTNNHKIYISLRNEENEELTFEKTFNNSMSIQACDTANLYFSFSSREMDGGGYEFFFGIKDGITYPSINSKRNKLLVTKN